MLCPFQIEAEEELSWRKFPRADQLGVEPKPNPLSDTGNFKGDEQNFTKKIHPDLPSSYQN